MAEMTASIMYRRSISLLTRLILSLALPVLLLQAGCAWQLPQAEPVELPTRSVPEERLLDLRLAAFMGNQREIRALQYTNDPVAWLDEYWAKHDPTPGTPENELLEVYRQRATWLESSFPGTPFGELATLWSLFLRYGLPDVSGQNPYFDGSWQGRGGASAVTSRTRFQGATRLRYGTPRPFILLVREAFEPATAVDRAPPRQPPTLEGAWEDLKDPEASVWRKQRALLFLSWYELPAIAEQLLALPEESLAGCLDQFEDTVERLTVRACYLLPRQGIQRVAVLRAARADPRMVVGRTMSASYTADELAADLGETRRRAPARLTLERMPDRGPHVKVWQNPEELISDLPLMYPSKTSLTGWDWRGDTHLWFGSSAFINQEHRIAYYTWGSPEVIQVGESMLGTAHARRIEDTLMTFLDRATKEVEKRQSKGRAAGTTLSTALRKGSDDRRQSSHTLILEQLHVLSPPPVFQIGLPDGSNQLPLTMDAVAFPAGVDSIEVQVSIGLPTSAVQIHQTSIGYTTDLITTLVVFDHDLNIVYSEERSLGYLIEGTPELEDQLLLDTFRFRTIPGSYIAYLSVEDPQAGTSGGTIQSLDFNWHGTPGLQVSPIMLASDVEFEEGEGKFHRGEYYILPAPSRYFYSGTDLFIYFEISNLTPSEFGDHVWSESYYVIPDAPEAGIVIIVEDRDYGRLTPQASRSMQIDLSGLEAVYEGPIFLVVLITDETSGEQAVGVTQFNVRRRLPPG